MSNVWQSVLIQAIGIVAMIINISSYQFKSQRTLIFMQMISSTLYAVNLGFLGAVTGCVMNLIGAFRALVFSHKQTFHAEKKIWLYGFILSYFAVFVLNFAVFHIERESVGIFALLGFESVALRVVLEFLPVVGMCASTVSYYMEEARDVRRLCLVSSPCWLVYHSVSLSIGGGVGEILVLTSAIVGIFRYDRKREKQPDSL